jgi:hypothetical protein
MTEDYEAVFLALADSDIPDEAIEYTLEALEGELTLKGANVAAFILNLEAESDKVKAVEKRISDRRKMLDNKADRMRDYLKLCMERAAIKSITAIDSSFKVTLTAPRASVVIDDVSSLPPEYTKTRIEPDKTAIKAAIDGGNEIKGAHIEMKSGLRIA